MEFKLENRSNQLLLRQILAYQSSTHISKEKRNLIKQSGGSEKYKIGRTALSMLHLCFDLLEKNEISDKEKETLRKVLHPKFYKRDQVPYIPLDFFRLHKNYLPVDKDLKNYLAHLESIYSGKKHIADDGTNTDVIYRGLLGFLYEHNKAGEKHSDFKQMHFIAGEKRASSGRSYPVIKTDVFHHSPNSSYQLTNMKVLQGMFSVIPSIHPITLDWQSRLFTVMHLTMIALDYKHRKLKDVLLHFLKNYGLDENDKLPMDLLKEAQSKVLKFQYKKVGAKGVDDYIGLANIWKAFNDPENYGAFATTPIDAVAQNWVIFQANVTQNLNLMPQYNIPTNRYKKFYDILGADPNTYHSSNMAVAIMETIKEMVKNVELDDTKNIVFKAFDLLLAMLFKKYVPNNKKAKKLLKTKEHYGWIRNRSLPFDEEMLKETNNLLVKYETTVTNRNGVFHHSNKPMFIKYKSVFTPKDIDELIKHIKHTKFNRNFAKYVLMVAGYGGSFRELNKGLKETLLSMQDAETGKYDKKEYKEVLIYANFLRAFSEYAGIGGETEFLDKVIKSLGQYRALMDTILTPKKKSASVIGRLQKNRYTWHVLPDTTHIYRLHSINYEKGKKVKYVKVPINDIEIGSLDGLMEGDKKAEINFIMQQLRNASNKIAPAMVENYAFVNKPKYIEDFYHSFTYQDKAPVSLFVHSIDSTLKDKVKEYFLKAEQGDILTNHDSYSPHSQFAFDFMDKYIQTFKEIMSNREGLKNFYEAFSVSDDINAGSKEYQNILNERCSDKEFQNIICIPNEYWINMIWNV